MYNYIHASTKGKNDDERDSYTRNEIYYVLVASIVARDPPIIAV